LTAAAATGRFAVGVDSIDALHEECEAALQRLSAAVETGDAIVPALEALHEHLVRHFGHEEALMAETLFPPAGCHQREHAMVLEVVAEVRKRFTAGERDPALRLTPAVLEWFELHAASMDAALAAWLASARADAADSAPAG
jgi:hemerythrin-like metal-binding protein